MPTQGERQNFNWRPNDNSATTRVRYDLEAEHWLKSFKSASIGQKTSSFRSDLSFIGLVFGLLVNLFSIAIMLLTMFLKWVFNVASPKAETYANVKHDIRLTNEELKNRRESGKLKIVNIYED